MSQYHKHCCSSSTPAKKPLRNKKIKVLPKIEPEVKEPDTRPINMVGLLTTKAFCDCKHCACRDCPDILKMLSITVSDTTCHFGSKVSGKDSIPTANRPKRTPLLDVINQERDCNCGVVARGIRDHIHMNLGMTGRREKIKEQTNICDSHCVSKAAAVAKPKAVVIKENVPGGASTDNNNCDICDSTPRL